MSIPPESIQLAYIAFVWTGEMVATNPEILVLTIIRISHLNQPRPAQLKLYEMTIIPYLK